MRMVEIYVDGFHWTNNISNVVDEIIAIIIFKMAKIGLC